METGFSNKRYLITGATGFIGSHYVKMLSEVVPPKNISCVVRSSSNYEELKSLNVNLVFGDIKSPHEFKDKLLNSNIVYHFAANSSFIKKGSYKEDNVDSTRKIIEILEKSENLELFFFASSIGAVDRSRFERKFNPLDESAPVNPRSLYGESKLECEELLQRSGIPSTILRITWAYGPGMRLKSHITTFIKDTNNGKFYSRINFPGKVSLIYISDLVKGIWALTKEKKTIGQTYFISDSNPISLGDIFNKINVSLNKKSKLIKIPSLFVFLLKLVTPLMPFQLSVLLTDSLACSDEKIRSLGIKPEVNSDEGIAKTVEWVKSLNNGAVALITGSSSGIGLSFVHHYLNAGIRVIGIDRNPPSDEIQKNGNFEQLTVDFTQIGQLEKLDDVLKELSESELTLVNCAGIAFKSNIQDSEISNNVNTLLVNNYAPVYLTSLIIKKQKKWQSIKIINVNSTVAFSPIPTMAVYGASKAFLSSFTKAIRYELKDSDVDIFELIPGGTRTNFQTSAGVGLDDNQKLLTPDEVVAECFQAIQKGKKQHIIGLQNKVLVLILKVIPESLGIRLWHYLLTKFR